MAIFKSGRDRQLDWEIENYGQRYVDETRGIVRTSVPIEEPVETQEPQQSEPEPLPDSAWYTWELCWSSDMRCLIFKSTSSPKSTVWRCDKFIWLTIEEEPFHETPEIHHGGWNVRFFCEGMSNKESYRNVKLDEDISVDAIAVQMTETD